MIKTLKMKYIQGTNAKKKKSWLHDGINNKNVLSNSYFLKRALPNLSMKRYFEFCKYIYI